MDTSDSECFESADESLHSDDDITIIISNKVKNLEFGKCENIEIKSVSPDYIRKPVEIEQVEQKDSKTPSKEVQSTKNEEILTEQEEKLERINEFKTVLQTADENLINKVVAAQSEKATKECKSNPKEKKLITTVEEDNLWAEDEGWGNLDTEIEPTVYDNMQLPADLKKCKLVSKYVPEEDKWEFDSWEPLSNERIEQEKEETGWSGWGNWGVSSIISTATQGVSTLTSQVSQGISNVLETGIGVPDPEELARINRQAAKEDNENITSDESNNPSLSFGLGNLVSGVSQITKIVESTGTKVINSGLDTLETIGKKTMEVLQEGDPGLKKKRAFLQINQEKPVLSQILREAKQKAEEENKILGEKHFAKKANYESIFDDYQGLVHLEALEMLSKQCDIKLQTILETYSGDYLKEIQETMEQVKELCEIPDEEDDEESISAEEIQNKLANAVSEIGIPITYDKLIKTLNETEDWLNKLNLSICNETELHQQAIETMAQLTAIAVEQFHKTGELLLIKEHRSTADEADSLVQLTTTLTVLIGIVAGKFSDKLNSLTVTFQNKEEINNLITNIFLEAANSSSYIQDAFHLLIPVLQVGAI